MHDNLPSPLQLAGTPTTTCTGGTLTGSQGQIALALNGSTLPSDGCTITATVVWPVSAAAACVDAKVINTIDSGVDFTTGSGAAQQDATAVLACPPIASIQVSKTVAETSVMAGASAHFTVSVANVGPVAGNGITINDPLTSDWASATWICSAVGGAACPAASGVGTIDVSGLNLPTGSALSYSVTAVAAGISNSASNTVSVIPGDGQCSSGLSSCVASATLAVRGGVQISKSRTSAVSAIVGDSVQYTVNVSNPTGVAMTQPVVVTDTLPAGLENGTWTCTGACGSNTSGVMPLAVTLESLAPQASATFALSAVAASSAQGTSIVNTATAVPTAPELCINGQSQCSASADAVQVTPIVPISPAPVPSLSQWAMLLLSVMIVGLVATGRLSTKR